MRQEVFETFEWTQTTTDEPNTVYLISYIDTPFLIPAAKKYDKQKLCNWMFN